MRAGEGDLVTIHHVVSLWLEQNTRDALHSLAAAARNLRHIPGVISADFATNTQGHGQATVDAALFVVFESQEAVDRYMPHPLHKKMIETVQKHACRVEPLFMQSVQLGDGLGSAEATDLARSSSVHEG